MLFNFFQSVFRFLETEFIVVVTMLQLKPFCNLLYVSMSRKGTFVFVFAIIQRHNIIHGLFFNVKKSLYTLKMTHQLNLEFIEAHLSYFAFLIMLLVLFRDSVWVIDLLIDFGWRCRQTEYSITNWTPENDSKQKWWQIYWSHQAIPSNTYNMGNYIFSICGDVWQAK